MNIVYFIFKSENWHIITSFKPCYVLSLKLAFVIHHLCSAWLFWHWHSVSETAPPPPASPIQTALLGWS